LDNPSRLTGETSRGLIKTEALSKKLLRMMTKLRLTSMIHTGNSVGEEKLREGDKNYDPSS
jgi:hypothetical protein